MKFKFTCTASVFRCKVWQPCACCAFASEQPEKPFLGKDRLYAVTTERHSTTAWSHTNLRGEAAHGAATDTADGALCRHFFQGFLLYPEDVGVFIPVWDRWRVTGGAGL